MKYSGLPCFMWILFKKSFRECLDSDLGYDTASACMVMKKAKSEKIKD